MKKILLLILTIIVISIGWGCSDCLDDAVSLDYLEQPVSSNTPYFVTLQDVQNLTKALSLSTRRANSSMAPEIICYEDAEHDTLLYICDNVGGGWTIYSSDTRVPPIVAQSDSCSFAHASENEALMAWVATIAEDMKVIKHASDAELNFTPSEIKSNKEFWKSISFPDEFVKEKLIENETRKELPPPTPDYSMYGHWELLSVEYYTQKYDSISRLTQTNWTQNYPCNGYCPYLENNPYNHAQASCGPIMVGQMLYFLHYKLGVPQLAPSQAYCYSDVMDYPDYNWDQTNYTSDIWNNMNSYGDYSGPLIANIGRRLHINYGLSHYGVTGNDMVDSVFKPYGINCIYSEYNTAYLKTDLLSGMPVGLLAAANCQGQTEGHAFIADRYLRKRDVTKKTYYWVYDSTPDNFPVPGNIPNKITYTYSSPYITMIGMNWGWGIWYNVDSEWFTLTGDWIKDGDNWNIDRHMIYNFSVIAQ